MTRRRKIPVITETSEANIAIWKEMFFGAELLLLHASPVFYGFGVPRGDSSGVVLIPGFLTTDDYLTHLNTWLKRIGYSPYLSGIGLNAECPNLLIRTRLNNTIDRALDETGAPIHLIGHSLGGVIARSVAAQRPDDVASVITIASPFRGAVVHSSILKAARAVRSQILETHGRKVMPDCFTTRCTCSFIENLRGELPLEVMQTAIYTRDDGIVDWRCCLTGEDDDDFEVPGTHIGLVFNPSVYTLIAERLAMAAQDFS